MSDRVEEQRQLILDQFTRQAVPFSEMPAHSNEESVRLLIDMAQIGPEDTVLDVACGPGLVACSLAEVALHVTGIDLTPAMIEQAQVRQRNKGLTNLTWMVGDAVPLPFPDAAYSVVVTRYSFHHFLDPKAVLVEMIRVRAGRTGCGNRRVHQQSGAGQGVQPGREAPRPVARLGLVAGGTDRAVSGT